VGGGGVPIREFMEKKCQEKKVLENIGTILRFHMGLRPSRKKFATLTFKKMVPYKFTVGVECIFSSIFGSVNRCDQRS